MRVLFTVIPDRSLFQSMVPLAWALRTAGHEVRVASQPSFAEVITQAGLTAAPVGRNCDLNRVAELKDQELREEYRAGLPAPWNAVLDPANPSWDDLLYGHLDAVDEGHRPDNFPMIAGLVEFARAWRPDLVVWEPLTYAGPIAAKACGAAHARLLWSLDVFGLTREIYLRVKAEQPPHERADPLAEWLGSYADKYGAEYTEDMTTGHATIDQLPPSLGMRAAGLEYLPMRYVPYGGAAVVPTWLQAPPARPRVAITLGITATDQFAGYAANLQAILIALGDLDIEVVATVAPTHRHRITERPANATIVDFVPLHALAPTCAAVVNHAGPGTFLTTAGHGVPQLMIPHDFDEPELARRAAAQGCGLAVAASQATGYTVRQRLSRLLGEPGFRDRAAALRAEMLAQPAPNDLVPHLEELAAKRRTR